MSDIGDIYKRYFTALLNMMKESKIWVPPRTPSSGQSQIIYSWPEGKDIAVNILKRKEIRVDLTLKSDRSNDEYLALERDKDDIETIIGKELEWNPNEPPTERQIIWRLNNTDPT